ncbi:MAG: hypothetical protein WCG26_07335, partial [Chloroflexales bacterium]
TIRTADLLDRLCDAYDIASTKVLPGSRWANALDAAYDHLLQVDEIEYRAADHALLYHSESGKSYMANGRCACTAWMQGQPCKHRSAARLVRNALALTPVVAPVGATFTPVVEPVAVAPVAPVVFTSRLVSGKTAQEEIDELFAA